MTTELRKPPTDGITRLRFSPVNGEHRLIVSSWDSNLRLYDTAANELLASYDVQQPLLDCTFLQDSNSCACAGIGSDVTLFDLATEKRNDLGSHKKPVRCLNFHPELNWLFSGSWDETFKTWDTRMKNELSCTPVNGKVYAMALNKTRLIVCDSSKRVSIFDIRRMTKEPEVIREQVMKYQYRTAEAFPDQNGFAVSSVEGRVAWEYLPTETTGKKSYAFKCHREKDPDRPDMEKVYPVNAIAFHPIYGTFATGGGDGTLSVWDGYKMKRLWRLDKFPTSITSVAFTASGTQMAIAVSYDFSQGIKSPVQPTQVCLRQVNDDDCQPKSG